ncbi:MAG: hypothetical protein ABW174_13680 [Flavitalea sp.]
MLIPPLYKTVYVKQGRLTITVHYSKVTAQDYQVFSGSPAFFSIMGTRECIVCVFHELLETHHVVDDKLPAGRRQALITAICIAIKQHVVNSVNISGKGPRLGNHG